MANHTQIDIYSIIDYVAEDRGEHEHGFAIEVALKVRAAYEAERDALKAEIEELKQKTSSMMGVGSGAGNLFVYGDYDSIKAAQTLLLQAENDRAELEAARKQEPIIIRTMEGFEFLKTYEIGTKLYASPVPAQQECTFHGADAQACMDYSKEVPCEFTWEQEAKRAFWCGLEIGAAFGSCAILPRWNEYIEKRKSELKGGENER